MANEFVTADQYPDLTKFRLRSQSGDAEFLGEVADPDVSCPTCGGSATSYVGPQYGLALQADVVQELTWCERCGPAPWRLVNPDGTPYVGL